MHFVLGSPVIKQTFSTFREVSRINNLNWIHYVHSIILIIKNTDPYKLRKCISCKKDIALNEKYFLYPLSLQQICLVCGEKEIPRIIETLGKDLKKIKEVRDSSSG